VEVLSCGLWDVQRWRVVVVVAQLVFWEQLFREGLLVAVVMGRGLGTMGMC
jgi:hypothetical protein